MRLLAQALLCSPLLAQSPPSSAADVSEEWRGLGRLFDRVIPPEDASGSDPRTLLLVLDATPSLASAGIQDALAAALERHAALLGRVKIGVQRVGTDKPLLAPSEDPQAILAAVRDALLGPSEKIQNVYQSVRDTALTLAARSGEHALLLATLDNGDAEDDLEATVARLVGTKTRLFVLAGESYLADCYWAAYPAQDHPKDTQLTGGDSGVIDLPWGWLFQLSNANEVAPSGFACYGLSRCAAGSSGRVWVYQPLQAGRHDCMMYGSCLFCSGDHAPESELYNRAQIAPLAPSVAARAEVLAALDDDPAYKAVLDAWRAALQAGFVRAAPPRAGHWTGVDTGAASRAALVLSGPAERNAERAEAGIKDCERILAQLDAALGRVDAAKASPRARAVGEFMRVMLQLTKTNLVGYVGWCREIAPRWFDKDAPLPLAPELPGIHGDSRNVTICYTTRSLCHGAKVFLEIELPGGERFKKELLALDERILRFEERYAHTPWVTALHRQGIATFHQTGPITNLERQRPKSRNGTDPGPKTGEGSRPARRAGNTGSGTGPATGGGGG